MAPGFKLNSSTPLIGILKVEKVYSNGDRELHIEKKNVITLAAKQSILSGLYISNTSDPIISLHIGIGGTLDTDGLYPKPVSQSLTSLYSDYLTIATSYSIAPSVPSVTFLATVPEASANGQLISEAGLFCQSGTMFNVLTYPAVPKTAQFALSYSWTVNVS